MFNPAKYEAEEIVQFCSLCEAHDRHYSNIDCWKGRVMREYHIGDGREAYRDAVLPAIN